MGKEYKLDESELLSILEEVRDSLDSMIGTETVQKSEENEIVAKAEGSEEKPKKKEASKEGGNEEGESDPAAEVAPDESAPAGEVTGSAPPPVAADPIDDSAMAAPEDMSPMESAQAVSPEAEPAGQEAGVIEPAPTVAELQAEYEKLSDEELALHVMAAKAAANNRNAAAAPAAPDPMAAMAPAAPAPPAPVMKSENEAALEKSLKTLEEELAKAKADKEKQAKVIDELYEAYTRPVRKSLRFVSELPPSTPKVDVAKLSKEAVAQKLNEVTRDPELKKSDRDLVNKFYNGSVKIEALEHLLK